MATEMTPERACAVMDAWLATEGWAAVYRGIIELYEARLAREATAEPLVCPSWGELVGNCEPSFFSKEVCAEYDATHPIRTAGAA
jgi:hypothetical protein